MALRIDPRLPAVWRTPTTLQFGVSAPSVVLEGLDVAGERMLAALSSGISRSGLGMIGRSAGASDAEIDALLTRLQPVLIRDDEPPAHRVVVCGAGRLADRLVIVLAAAGLQVVVAPTVEAAEIADGELAIAVGHYVLDPALHGLWLRRDLAHLPVVYSDLGVAIGPLVVPGETPCLYCLQRHASDADPAWPAISSQLWGRRSPADTELLASEAAAVVAREVVARLRGGAAAASNQLVIDAETGRRSRRDFEIHPECGCVELGRATSTAGSALPSAAARPGSGSEFATGPAISTPRPTTGRAAFSRE